MGVFVCHEEIEREQGRQSLLSPFAKRLCSKCHRPHVADNNQLLVSSAEKICFTCHTGNTVNQAHKNYPQKIKVSDVPRSTW